MLTYTDLTKFDTYEDRLNYLRVDGVPSELTFANLRTLNQRFYNSHLWRKLRRFVITRDLGCDLGVPGLQIVGKPIVHHMNPLRPKDILQHTDILVNPEFLITVSHETHLSIHFGHKKSEEYVERNAGDTKLW